MSSKDFYLPKNEIKEVAERVWDQIMGFGKYAFPRAHSAGYSYLSNATQYLKQHFPVEFFKNHLDYASHDEFAKIKSVAERIYGVEFIMPDINLSKEKFLISDNKIVWSLSAIKGLGEKASSAIVEKQPYTSFEDFFDRVNKRQVNKSKMAILITVNAFKDFGNREYMIKLYHEFRKEKLDGRSKYSKLDEIGWDGEASELLGFELFDVYDAFSGVISNYNVYNYRDFCSLKTDTPVSILGKITKVYKHKIKKTGADMMFVDLNVDGENVSVVIWSDTLQDMKDSGNGLPRVGEFAVFGGRKQKRKGEHQISLDVAGYIYEGLAL